MDNSSASKAPVRMVDGELIINPNNRAFWDNPSLLAQYQYQSGFWSTADPSHVIFHETGHEALVQSIQRSFVATGIGRRFPKIYGIEAARSTHDEHYTTLKLEDEIPASLAALILAEVGRQALVSMGELVAEVFAGLIAGKTYSPEVIRQYKGHGGPDI